MKSWVKRALRQAAWAPVAVFMFYALAAKGFNAYILYPWLDMPTHFFGGVAITYFCVVSTEHLQAEIGHIPKIIRLLLGTKMNLGVSDTLSDLFFGLLGGVVTVVVASRNASQATRDEASPSRVRR